MSKRMQNQLNFLEKSYFAIWNPTATGDELLLKNCSFIIIMCMKKTDNHCQHLKNMPKQFDTQKAGFTF